MVEEGCTPDEVAYMTPKFFMKALPDLECEERNAQLEDMWENPEAKTNR